MAIRAYTVQTQAVYLQSGTVHTRSVSQSLGLTDEAKIETRVRVYTLQTQVVYSENGVQHLSQNLALAQSTGLIHETNNVTPASDSLNLVQTVELNLQKWPEHDLGLTQTATFLGPQNISHQETIFLQQAVVGEFGLRWSGYEVSHDLNLTQVAGREYNRSASNTLTLTQEAFTREVVEHDLNLTHEALVGFGFVASNTLDITHTAEVDADLGQSLTHNLDVEQAAAYFIESRCGRLQRNDFHGVGGVEPAPERLVYPNTFIVWSKDDTDDSVELRNPETDDRRRYNFQRVNRDFFDGTLDLYVDDAWSTEERQIYTIVSLKRATLETLWTFLDNHLGRQVYIKDWKGTTWLGIITNPGEVYTEDAEGYWTIDFEVQAVPQEGEAAGSELDLSQSVSGQWIYTRAVTDELGLEQTPHRGGPIYVSTENTIPFQQGA